MSSHIILTRDRNADPSVPHCTTLPSVDNQAEDRILPEALGCETISLFIIV